MHFVLTKSREGLSLLPATDEDQIKSLKKGEGLDTVANERVIGSYILKPPSMGSFSQGEYQVAFDAIMALSRLDDNKSVADVLGEIFKLGFLAHQILLAEGKIKKGDKLL